MLTDGNTIDPDAWHPISGLLALDTCRVYGERIWMLFKDVCGGSLNKALALLRAVQLGFLSETTLNHAIDNRGEGVDVPEMCRKVKERLPKFEL